MGIIEKGGQPYEAVNRERRDIGSKKPGSSTREETRTPESIVEWDSEVTTFATQRAMRHNCSKGSMSDFFKKMKLTEYLTNVSILRGIWGWTSDKNMENEENIKTRYY